MDYLSQIISFIIGGGLSTIVNLRLNKKSQSLDFTEKAVKFLEDRTDKLMEDIKKMQLQIDILSELKCEKNPCKHRIPPSAMEIKQDNTGQDGGV